MDFSIMQKALRDCNMFQDLDEGQLGLLAMNAEEKERLARKKPFTGREMMLTVLLL